MGKAYLPVPTLRWVRNRQGPKPLQNQSPCLRDFCPYKIPSPHPFSPFWLYKIRTLGPLATLFKRKVVSTKSMSHPYYSAFSLSLYLCNIDTYYIYIYIYTLLHRMRSLEYTHTQPCTCPLRVIYKIRIAPGQKLTSVNVHKKRRTHLYRILMKLDSYNPRTRRILYRTYLGECLKIQTLLSPFITYIYIYTHTYI